MTEKKLCRTRNHRTTTSGMVWRAHRSGSRTTGRKDSGSGGMQGGVCNLRTARRCVRRRTTSLGIARFTGRKNELVQRLFQRSPKLFRFLDCCNFRRRGFRFEHRRAEFPLRVWLDDARVIRRIRHPFAAGVEQVQFHLHPETLLLCCVDNRTPGMNDLGARRGFERDCRNAEILRGERYVTQNELKQTVARPTTAPAGFEPQVISAGFSGSSVERLRTITIRYYAVTATNRAEPRAFTTTISRSAVPISRASTPCGTA